jgi:hypothetical protein
VRFSPAPRERRGRKLPEVSAARQPPRGEDLGYPRPVPIREEVADGASGEKTASMCTVEQREQGVRCCGKQQPDGRQRTASIRPEDLELVLDPYPLPVAQAEVRDDALLMANVGR